MLLQIDHGYPEGITWPIYNEIETETTQMHNKHLRGGDWVHVPNMQIDIYVKTRDLLNTGVGLVYKEVIVCANM